MRSRLILTALAVTFAHAAFAQLPLSIAVLGIDDLGNGTRTTRTWTDFNHSFSPDCDILNISADGECGAEGSLSTLTPLIVADPGPGGLALALSYRLPLFIMGTQGDVLLLEGGTTRGVLRFNGNGTVIVYSGLLPEAFHATQAQVQLESGGARTVFIPLSGQPGFGYRDQTTGESVPPATPNGSTRIVSYLTYHFVLSAPTEGISAVAGLADSLGFGQGQNLIQEALSALESGETSAACGQLTAFVNQVESQMGKQLTQDEADKLILTASSVMGKVGCF